GRVERKLKLATLDEDRRVAKRLEAADVIEMEVRLDHEIDVRRLHADARKQPLDVVVRSELQPERSGIQAEPGLGIGGKRRMQTTVEQDRAPRMRDEEEEVRVVDLRAHALVERIEAGHIRQVAATVEGVHPHVRGHPSLPRRTRISLYST